jgi:hypothetical protein
MIDKIEVNRAWVIYKLEKDYHWEVLFQNYIYYLNADLNII